MCKLKSGIMRILFTICFAQIAISLFSQVIHIPGTVYDSEIQQPVPNVSIFTEDNKIGTISTLKGKFSLDIPSSKSNSYLYFRSVEYETDSLLISKIINPLSIQLTPKSYLLKEVYIMPDSTLYTLLKKAFNKIPENYPDQPTRYEGFFQTSVLQNDSLVELIEAVLAVYKESYTKTREMPGQIQIVKSRMKQLQNSPGGFVGGPFIPVDGDVVLKRASYITPAKMKYFKYDFLGIKNYSGRDCYEIAFKPLNKDSANIQGNMLIDTKTLSYMRFELNTENQENNHKLIGMISPTENKIVIIYEQYKGKWYLKQISSRNKYDNIRLPNPLFSSIDFISTYIQTDSVYPIPVEKRLEYLDPIEAKTEKYNPKGWTDSEIIANENPKQLGFQFSTDEALSIYSQNIPKKKTSFNEAIIKIIPKLKLGYGLSFNFDKQLIMHQSIIGYKFNKRWSIHWQATEDFFVKNVKYTENELGIEFRKNINNAGYPLFLGTSLGIADSRFNSKSESIKEQTIIPQLSLSKRTSRFFTFELFVNYPVVIHSSISPDRGVTHYPRIGINMFLF